MVVDEPHSHADPEDDLQNSEAEDAADKLYGGDTEEPAMSCKHPHCMRSHKDACNDAVL